jgi:hypothetical protein
MSKFCSTEEEAQQTVAKYQSDFATGTSPYATPAYRQSKDKSRWIVYNQDSGKILKNMNYRAVNLSSVVPAYKSNSLSNNTAIITQQQSQSNENTNCQESV